MKYVWITLLTTMTTNLYAQSANHHFQHTDSTRASPEKIWSVWIDVAQWKTWDKGLKEAQLNGAFSVGTKGKLIPDKGPKSTFVISKVVEGQSYQFKTRIPFGWLIIDRRLEVKNDMTYFTHEVQFTGSLKKVLGKKLGKNYRAMLPEVMSEIKRIAESK